MWVFVKHLLVYYYPTLPLTVICAIVADNCCFPADAAAPTVVVGYSAPTAVGGGVAVVVGTAAVGSVLADSSDGIIPAVE